MTRYLTINVRAHEGRYHGGGTGLPSPFRLFQALVAGVGISGPLDEESKQALTWLERLPDAPIIASPRTILGQSVSLFMPNNDLDAKGGDVRRVGEIRLATKAWKPRIFDAAVPWMYAWPFANNDEGHAVRICALSEKLYQFGRGVDMAWAWGECLDESALEARLAEYDGVVRRASVGDGILLACPRAGSLESLERRYQSLRFRYEDGQRVFVQPPKPSYRQLTYVSPPTRHVFELRSTFNSERRVAWPLVGVSPLVVAAREAARARLSAAMPGRMNEIDRHLVGRKPDGSNAAPAENRVRIIPIPSIGTHHADRAIRRLLIEVPAACPIRSDDIRWAFSGVELFGELKDVLLVPSTEDNMLRHFGVDASARVFRSVTPVALPENTSRRRVEPTRKLAEAKPGLERLREIAHARVAVVQALRHAGIHTAAEAIHLQREPFDASGSRVEPFSEGTRFQKGRLWHLELSFTGPTTGPLLIGDGRFVGLGLMAPVTDIVPGVHAFAIADGLSGQPQPIDLARALRRAVMARVQSVIGVREQLAPFFSGHAADGAPIRSPRASHLAFAFESDIPTLLILSPHIVERRAPTHQELQHLRVLDVALEGFRQLRASGVGLLTLFPIASRGVEELTLLGRSRVWQTTTPYVVTRHAKCGAATDALAADVRAECRRLRLPQPKVESIQVRGMPGIGLTGNVTLLFQQSVVGPLLLGRTRHLGGGLFRPVGRLDQP